MFRATFFMIIIAVLTGCGGGGGVGGNTDTPERPPVVSAPTAMEVTDTIAAIGSTTTGLLMSDLQSTPGSRVFPNERVEANCQGTSCEPEPSWGEPYYSATELSALADDATIRMGDPQYGVNYGEVSWQNAYRDPQYPEEENFSTDYTVYGGWLSQNFFGVERGQWSGRLQYGSVEGLETLIAFSTGAESGSNPVTGSAEWTGLVVALDRTAPDRAVQGKAALTYDFDDATLDVLFSDLRGARTHGDLSWDDLAVANGRFGQGSGANSLEGTFYGGAHEEAGGVFERNGIVGAFGAAR